MQTGVPALIFLGAAACFAQPGAVWHDPSPHTVRFVTVDKDVRVEVLDWGGSGPPVVLLAGYLTAHVYDDFAGKLSQICHVYGVTRRGFGASSRPDSGYSAERSADDVVKVLDALKLNRAVLAGHSFGGQDLNTLGAQHADRLAGLVYLNSAEDATLGPDDYGVQPPDGKRLPAALREPPAADRSSFQAYREWQLRVHGVAFPESELRQTVAAGPNGSMGQYLIPQSVRDAMFKAIQKPDFRRVGVPVLAFFSTPTILAELTETYKPQNADERLALAQKYAFDLAIVNRHMYDLRRGVPTARIIALPGANFYVFLSNEADLLREIKVFLDGLK